MASNQERRENTNIEGRQVHVERDRVPKITSHFESLTVSPASNVVSSAHDRQLQSGGETRREDEGAKGQTVGKFEMQEKDDDQDISKYRQIAQQNSMDALRAAEERYNQSKDLAAQKVGATKDNLAGAGNTAAEYSLQTKDYVAQKAVGAKDVAAEKAAAASDVAAQKAAAARDAATEKAAAARDMAAQKAAAARDVTAEKAAMARDVVAEKAAVAKDVVTKKAAVAKDMTVETGKGTAGYVGKVAADVKDKTVMAGWGAAEYTAEKFVGATKAVAGATAGAADYVGEKAVAAKDVVGSAGVTAKDYAAQKLAAAKDAVVSTEESAKEYAARKRAAKERELQARKVAESKGEVWSGGETTEEKHDIAGETGEALETAEDTISKPVQKAGEYFEGQPECEREGQHGCGETKYREAQQGGGNGGGVLHAIGETIVEIGQTTKGFLVGQGKGGSSDQCK